MPFPKGYNPWEHRKKKTDVEGVKIEVKSITVSPVPPLSPEGQKDTMKRHTIGMMSAVESVYGPCFTPKCSECYRIYGYLTKCVCK